MQALELLSYDTETTGLNVWDSEFRVFSFSTCSDLRRTETIRVCRLDGSPLRQVQSRAWLDQVVSGKHCLIMHNSKFDLYGTEKLLGRSLNGIRFHDTSIMSRLIQNDHLGHRLKDLAWELADVPVDDEAAIKPYIRAGGRFDAVPEPLMNKYQERDAARTMLLALFFFPIINREYAELYETEMTLIKTTMRLERRGFMLNRERCSSIILETEGKLRGITNELGSIVGEPFKATPNLCRWLLFEKFKLPILKRTPTGLPSVDKDVLLELRKQGHGCRALELVIAKAAYEHGIAILKSYLKLADADGIIHPNINTCGTITGRESSSRPNLQNVEKTGVLLNPYPTPARRAFRPKPGYVNFHIDYAGQEIRLLCHYSGETRLIDIICSGGDVHEPAALIFYGGRYQDAVGPTRKGLREATKGANFAIPYGASMTRAAGTLGLTVDEFKPRYAEYKRQFPKFVQLGRRITQEASENGFIKNAWGRKLNVPRDEAYIATNYLIQSSGAELLKRAQNRVDAYLRETTGDEVGIILPIHDEIVIEFPRKHLRDAPEILRGIRERMIDFPQLSVPLEIEVQTATVDWENLKEWKL